MFLFDAPTGYRGEHFRGAEEMLEVVPATPVDKARAVEHYAGLAEEAREHRLAHELRLGAITIEECLDGLAEGSQYLDGYSEVSDGLRFGGTIEIAPSVQARI